MTEINRSYVSQLNFAVTINRLPNTNFDLQSANIPGITIGVASEPTPFVKKPWPGDHVDYDKFTISFKVDEKFNNWFEIHKWMTGQGFPRNFHEYAALKQGTDKALDGTPLLPQLQKDFRRIGNIFSQITLQVLTSHKNPILVFDFIDAHPIAMSGLELKTTDIDVEYLTVSATFAYDYYNVKLP